MTNFYWFASGLNLNVSWFFLFFQVWGQVCDEDETQNGGGKKANLQPSGGVDRVVNILASDWSFCHAIIGKEVILAALYEIYLVNRVISLVNTVHYS